jgi:hypothetical protein
MTRRKLDKAKEPTKIVADDPEDRKGILKGIGGSQSDHWNNLLANQVVQALWVSSDPETRNRQFSATVAALVGIGPKDEIEGTLAAQMIAAYNAAMECHRRAMIGEQTFEGRKENLTQANKLSRTYTTLLEALNRHRGKGQQKVTVEHVQASKRSRWSTSTFIRVGKRSWAPSRPAVGWQAKIRDMPMQKQLPMHLSPRCGARTRSGKPCRSPAMPNGRCRLHGGASPRAKCFDQAVAPNGRRGCMMGAGRFRQGKRTLKRHCARG